MLISLVIKISRYARNDKKMNYDTVSQGRGTYPLEMRKSQKIRQATSYGQ